MNFSRAEVIAACRKWATKLWLPPEINGPQLLWALAGNESSFGANCAPRHEPAYDVGGVYAKNPEQARLLELFGSAGACSYGPWQEMLVNCSPGTRPEDLAENVNRCALEAAGFINDRILRGQKARTIEEIAEAYNSGKWKWEEVPRGVATYVADCVRYYNTEPDAGDGVRGADVSTRA
ncbi:MAG TPA: hypothetical protein VFW25_12530 [Silvibacterium sp.]|nr:hypothetical protein [Silvibacterium sp.]